MTVHWKHLKAPNNIKGQSGQAAIEYILLLVIIVGLVISMAYQVFTPMQKFLDNYMGQYVSCLLEYGELPSFGGESPVTEDGQCNKSFESFSVANGRQPNGSSSGSGFDKDGDGKSDSSKASGSASGGSGTSYAGSASRSGARALRSGRGSSGADSGAKSDKVTEIPLAGSDVGGSGGYYGGRSGNRIVIIRKTSSIPNDRIPESLRKKMEKNRSESKTVNIVVDAEGSGIKPKVLTVKPPERKIAEDESNTEFSFGSAFRIAIIAAIIIVVVIFVGGQFLQMSKNSD